MRENRARALMRAGQPALGTWISSASGLIAEIAGYQGFDWVNIDTEHGETGYDQLPRMLQAISATAAIPLVRLAWNEPMLFKRALDMGAYGVVVPLVSTVEEARAAVQACRYPPLGERGWGATRGTLYGGADYFARANDEILLMVMTETKTAVQNAREILSLPGVDGCFIGPNDLSISYGHSPGLAELPADVKEGIQAILAAAKAADKFPGIHTYSVESARRRIAEGFRFVALSSDVRFFQGAARSMLESVRA